MILRSSSAIKVFWFRYRAESGSCQLMPISVYSIHYLKSRSLTLGNTFPELLSARMMMMTMMIFVFVKSLHIWRKRGYFCIAEALIIAVNGKGPTCTVILVAKGCTRKTCLLLNGAGYTVTTNTENSELFGVFFASVFMTEVSQISMFSKRGWGGDELPVVYDNQLRNYLREHEPYKSMGPQRLHLRVLRGLCNVLARLLSIIFEELWKSREVPVN